MSNTVYLPPGSRPFNRRGRHGSAFSDDEIRAIRKCAAEGMSRAQLARSYCVSKQTIDRIVLGWTYAHVPDEALAIEEETPPAVKHADLLDDAWQRLMAAQQAKDAEKK